MDCNAARLLLAFFRPGNTEMEAEEIDALERHLAECDECRQLAARERRIDERFAAAVRDVQIPDHLHERIAARLEVERASRRRVLFHRRARWAAVAAMLFIGLYGVHWSISKPVMLDIDQLSEQIFGETTNPSSEAVAEWFRERKTVVVPPSEFNYQLLSYYSFADLQGIRVPLLVFTAGKAQARVFVISEKQFALRALAAQTLNTGSGCKSIFLPFDDGRQAYLVFYTGDSLDTFLVPSAQN